MDVSAISSFNVAVHMYDDDRWSTVHFPSLLCCFRQSIHGSIVSHYSPNTQMLCKVGRVVVTDLFIGKIIHGLALWAT